MAWFGRLAYNFALRCNGVAINFRGNYGMTKAEERYLSKVAPGFSSGVILDVGANEGFYGAFVRRIAPQCRIFAFEPHPSTYARLAQRSAPLSIAAINLALSDVAGTVDLFDFAADDGSSMASLSEAAVGFYDEAATRHSISAVTLDAWHAENEIAEVALLKIDTEGFDYRVLLGAAKAIAAKKFKIIQFEFIPANIVTRGTMRDIFSALLGYDVYRICLNGQLLPLSPYSVKYCEIYITQNLIALPT